MSDRRTKIVTRYLHHESDEFDVDLWPDIEAPQHEKFHYALYEVRVDLEVDLDTGQSRIVAVDGTPLAELGEFR